MHIEIRRTGVLSVLMLLAIGLRLYQLDAPFLRWDEGWSMGLSSLGWGEICRITALDVHPPLYYYLFKLWFKLGKSTFWVRYFSVWWGVLAVALAYVTGRRWARSATVGLWAAAYVALAPFLIYYAQVTRMYSLAGVGCLGATYFALRAADTRRLHDWGAFVAAGVIALYTFYYSGVVLVALFAYLIAIHRRRLGAVALGFLLVAFLCLPWIAYAWIGLATRVGQRTGFQWAWTDALRFWGDGFYGLVFAYGAGWDLVRTTLALLTLGVLLSLLGRRWPKELILPTLSVVLSLGGVSLGAKAHMFAARYLIMASPFLGLAVAWALAQVQRLWRPAVLLVALVYGVIAFPTLKTAYSKPLEVVDPFDPHAFHRYLASRTRQEDVVFLNVLSTAGLYEHDRASTDPPWSYALRWDPIIEPMELAVQERILPAASSHRRLWFVLYKGTYAYNYDLKAWLDSHLYPAFAEWQRDTLYVMYVSPNQELAPVRLGAARFGGYMELREAALTPQASPGGEVAVELQWRAAVKPERDYKVFLHLYAPDGQLVTQHDAMPMNDLRPTSTWEPGEEITDHHGLALPLDAPVIAKLAVGLYEPGSGERLRLDGGEDHLLLGTVRVTGK